MLESNAYRLDRYNEDASKFYTAKGQLTSYALACGYQETIDFNVLGLDIQLELWYLHNRYYVRAWNFTEGKEISHATYDSLTEARDNFNTLKRNIKNRLIS